MSPKERNYNVGNKHEIEIMDGGGRHPFVVLTDHHNFGVKKSGLLRDSISA